MGDPNGMGFAWVWGHLDPFLWPPKGQNTFFAGISAVAENPPAFFCFIQPASIIRFHLKFGTVWTHYFL